MKAALNRYNIASLQYIINIGESGVSFKDIVGRKRCYGMDPRQDKIMHTVAQTVGKLDHVTVVSVVHVMGRLFKPISVFRGNNCTTEK